MSHHRSEPDGSLRLAGRVVDAVGQGVAGARVWIDSLPVHAVTSDRDGRFELESLVSRSYEVRAQAGDLIGGPHVIRLAERSAPIAIELSEGSHVMVTVVDATRAPIANASVRVIGNDSAATTDARGKARITTHPGSVAIEVTARGCAPRREVVTAASSGTTARVTIVLREGFEVRGRVLDEARRPIPSARVYAHPSSSDFRNEEQATAITDEGGAFLIPSAVGTHTFLAIDDERAPTRSAAVDIDRAITDLEIVMKAGAVYAGHVVGADGKRVAHARVYVDTIAGPGPRWFCTSSDANGAFEIRGLPRTIGRTDEDWDAAVVYAVSDDGVSDDVMVRFAKQRELRGQELALRRIDTTGVISGVVVDDIGAPVANVQVNAAARATSPLSNAIIMSKVRSNQPDPSTATSTRTNARGEFSIFDLPAGEYGIWPGAFGQHPFTGFAAAFLVGEDVSPFVTSAKTGDTAVRLIMPRAGRITGKVAVADTGEFVEEFELDVFARNELATGVPGEYGAFELRDLRPGTFRLRIRGPGFLEAWRADVRVDAGQSVDLGTITVERGRTLSGTVVDSAGRGIAGASVMLGEHGVFQHAGRFDASLDPSCALTDANGAFAIVGGVPVKSWRLAVDADHASYGRALPLAIPSGAQDPPLVTLTLLECGSLAGTLTRNGQPLYHAGIDAGYPAFGAATTNEDGEFVMPRLPAGSVVLRIRPLTGAHDPMEGLRAHQRIVQVEAQKRTDVTIEVPEGSIKLSVIVTPRPGAVIVGARLYLFSGTVAFESYAELVPHFLDGVQGRADWKGDVTYPAFERLVPGDYTVCTIPLAGSPNDQKLMKRLYNDLASVKVYCTPVRVAAAPEEQTVTVEPLAIIGA